MSEDIPATPWSVEKRLIFIRQRLIWQGSVNRADLMAAFQISANQATLDLRQFETRFPDSLHYDPRRRTYRPGPGLEVATDADTTVLLRVLRLRAEGLGDAEPPILDPPPDVDLGVVPPRGVAPAVLAAVLAAIRDQRALRAEYVSMRSSRSVRRLEPHALVHDGFRWHVRARDADAAEPDLYKDYLLARLSQVVVEASATGPGAAGDTQWNTQVALVIAPHPGLDPAQREAVMLDYGMDPATGHATLWVRQATAWYARKRLGLVEGHRDRPAQEQHIILVDDRNRG